MTRRRKTTQTATYPEGWVVSESCTVNGRNLVPGTEVSVRGQKGRFRFIKHVVNGDKEWIDVMGGANEAQFRSFRPSQVRTVHRKNRTRANLKG